MRNTERMTVWVRVVTLAAAWTAATNLLFAQSLTWLGTLATRYNDASEALDVSSDGSVVVGKVYDDDGSSRAFRWTQSSGMVGYGSVDSEARGVSADGTIFVGSTANSNGDFRAVRWRPSGTGWSAQQLGVLTGGRESYAFGVSSDGSVVVGAADVVGGNLRAFRWTQGAGMRDLGALPGDNRSIANAVSSDGNTVVGYAYYSDTSHYAVRWTPSDTSWNIQSLGTLGGDRSEATAASADGSVIVGWSDTVGNFESRAFRWTVSGGMQNIGENTGVGFGVVAHDVSADGNVIVGEGYNNNYYAFRWTSGGGMENLNTTYANLLTNGSRLEVAYAISSDGRYIVGKGYNAATRRFEAFLLDTGSRCTTHSGDVDSSGCVDDADLLSVLFAFGSSGSNLGRVDVNCDGTVDDADLLQVLFNFGSGC